jgi:hypothetical protein
MQIRLAQARRILCTCTSGSTNYTLWGGVAQQNPNQDFAPAANLASDAENATIITALTIYGIKAVGSNNTGVITVYMRDSNTGTFTAVQTIAAGANYVVPIPLAYYGIDASDIQISAASAGDCAFCIALVDPLGLR